MRAETLLDRPPLCRRASGESTCGFPLDGEAEEAAERLEGHYRVRTCRLRCWAERPEEVFMGKRRFPSTDGSIAQWSINEQRKYLIRKQVGVWPTCRTGLVVCRRF